VETWAMAASSVWSIVEWSQIFWFMECDSKFMRRCVL
jgi:hypothetical protein